MGDKVKRAWIIQGRVQGVGYRFFAQQQALALQITGCVGNADDGSVYCLAEGSGEDVDIFFLRLRQGPPHAVVESIEETSPPADSTYNSFVIKP
jgi:acylphosphatase